LPDLALPVYFLWGCVKNKVYETHPANMNDLKQIQEFIQVIPKEMLRCVTTPFHGDCRWELNDMMATYKVSYSNSTD
jgi:hypothetical protein